jgi:hypothetical protein
VVVSYGKESARTRVISNVVNPVWYDTLDFFSTANLNHVGEGEGVVGEAVKGGSGVHAPASRSPSPEPHRGQGPRTPGTGGPWWLPWAHQPPPPTSPLLPSLLLPFHLPLSLPQPLLPPTLSSTPTPLPPPSSGSVSHSSHHFCARFDFPPPPSPSGWPASRAAVGLSFGACGVCVFVCLG